MPVGKMRFKEISQSYTEAKRWSVAILQILLSVDLSVTLWISVFRFQKKQKRNTKTHEDDTKIHEGKYVICTPSLSFVYLRAPSCSFVSCF
jgi:hypothetical protein